MWWQKIIVFASILLFCSTSANHQYTAQVEAQGFIERYTERYVALYTKAQHAQWKLHTEIKQGDSGNLLTVQKAEERKALFTGSKENIERALGFLTQKDTLNELQIRQLEQILYLAANTPQTVPKLVQQRINAENKQVYTLYGYQYMLDGKKVSTNDLDEILKKETAVNKRLVAWEVSKRVGPTLKSGLVTLRNLRNQIVQALGYPDFFTYQVSSYHMNTDEMMQVMDELMVELYPLYRELHTWMRYELANRYGLDVVPDYLPAHWLPNRWGQDWSAVVQVPGINLDTILKSKSADWIVQSGEAFYVSLGYPQLPSTFWQQSSLYPYSADSAIQKNNHASAWHIDLEHDVRSLMSVRSNTKWFKTVHHELGHIYYYLTYANNNLPPLLRKGANRAYHEAIGTMMALAAMQKSYLLDRGLIEASVETDSMQLLLKEALNSVVFIFFSAGTMSHFEHALYVDRLSPDKFNATWWAFAKKYQGIVPPSHRGEEYCDAATKTHINDDPAQYYDYALSYALLYQLHNHIAKNILHEDPHATNYFGQKGIGRFLIKLMQSGASKDWRQVLHESTGDELSAKAMREYFEPLMDWLHEQNKGRYYSLPEKAYTLAS